MTDSDIPTPQDAAWRSPANKPSPQDGHNEFQDRGAEAGEFRRKLTEFFAIDFDPHRQSPESFTIEYEIKYREILSLLDRYATDSYESLVRSHTAAVEDIAARRMHANQLAKQADITGSTVYSLSGSIKDMLVMVISHASARFAEAAQDMEPVVWERVKSWDTIRNNKPVIGDASSREAQRAMILALDAAVWQYVKSWNAIRDAKAATKAASSAVAKAIMVRSIGRERASDEHAIANYGAQARQLGSRAVTTRPTPSDAPVETAHGAGPWQFAGRDDARPALIQAPAAVEPPQDAPVTEPTHVIKNETAGDFRRRVTGEVKAAVAAERGVRAKLRAAKRVISEN